MASPDWEAIESAYRAGLMSIREIASQQGITHTAINKRAKKEGWERDLKAKIKAKADSLVSKREVSKQVSTKKMVSERQLIEASHNYRSKHSISSNNYGRMVASGCGGINWFVWWRGDNRYWRFDCRYGSGGRVGWKA